MAYHSSQTAFLLACEPDLSLWSKLRYGKGILVERRYHFSQQQVLKFEPRRERLGELGDKGEEMGFPTNKSAMGLREVVGWM